MSVDAARVGDMHSCPKTTKLLVPHVGGPSVALAPVQVFAGGLPALRLGDLAVCTGSTDIVMEGAADILVEGLPWAGRSHKTAHGGVISGGLGSVLLGGPTFSLPSNVHIDGPTAFKNRLIRDLFDVWTWPGRKLFEVLERQDVPMTFVPDERCPTWPSGLRLRSDGRGRGVTIGLPVDRGSDPPDTAGCVPLPPHHVLVRDLVDTLLSLELPNIQSIFE